MTIIKEKIKKLSSISYALSISFFSQVQQKNSPVSAGDSSDFVQHRLLGESVNKDSALKKTQADNDNSQYTFHSLQRGLIQTDSTLFTLKG